MVLPPLSPQGYSFSRWPQRSQTHVYPLPTATPIVRKITQKGFHHMRFVKGHQTSCPFHIEGEFPSLSTCDGDTLQGPWPGGTLALNSASDGEHKPT